MSGVEDVHDQRRSYRAPHNARNPIPTIKNYREEQQRRQDQYGQPVDEEEEGEDDGRTARDKLGDAYNAFTGKGDDHINDGQAPYEAENKNLLSASQEQAEDHAGQTANKKNKQLPQDTDDEQDVQDTTEGQLHESDPKKA
jgi:hypothetical protein